MGFWYTSAVMPIKVGFLIASLRTGGKERMTVAVLRHLDRERFDPFLCVMNAGELLAEVQDQRVYAPLTRFRGDVFGFVGKLFRILRREKPQVLVCLSYRLTGAVGRILGKLLRVPLIIYELHGIERLGQRDLELPDRLIFKHMTDHLIAIGPDLRQNFIRDGFPAEKITLIRNGIDTDRFRPTDKADCKQTRLGFAPETPVIGCVSGMRPKKNLPLLVDAFRLVLASVPNAKLVFVGDGSERPTLEAHITQHDLWESVCLLGLRHDTPELLNAFDVLALSSVSEAAPLVVLEAGACGLPVVSTAVGEIPEMIKDGETGYLVPSGDAAALADRLIALLTQPDLRARMGSAARQHVIQHFSIGASVRAREALFVRLLHEKGII